MTPFIPPTRRDGEMKEGQGIWKIPINNF